MADHVELSGTLRSLGEDRRKRLLGSMQRIAEAVSTETGCSVRLEVSDSFPAVINDPRLYDSARGMLSWQLSGERVRVLRDIPMTADDFAHYLEAIPGLYLT